MNCAATRNPRNNVLFHHSRTTERGQRFGCLGSTLSCLFPSQGKGHVDTIRLPVPSLTQEGLVSHARQRSMGTRNLNLSGTALQKAFCFVPPSFPREQGHGGSALGFASTRHKGRGAALVIEQQGFLSGSSQGIRQEHASRAKEPFS